MHWKTTMLLNLSFNDFPFAFGNKSKYSWIVSKSSHTRYHYRILNWIEWVEFYSPHQNNQNFLINIIMIKVISWLLDYLLFSSRRVHRSEKRRYCASRGWDRYITKISKTTDIMKVWVPKVKVYICKV